MRHITIVLNPAAGRGQGARRRAELELLIIEAAGKAPGGQDEFQWEIVETACRGDGTRLAREAVERGASLVAAAGGGGAYGEGVNGLVGTGATLGIVPLGTGNDFSRHIGLGRDLAQAVDTLFNGAPRAIDLGRVQDKWFINVAGCGFDAVVAARVNRGFRLLRGTAAYVVAVVSSLLVFRPAHFRIDIDGKLWDTKAMLCTVANSSSFGGGMKIAPHARIDDGKLDVCVLGDAGRLEFLSAFPRVFKGTHVDHPKVTMIQARRILVESDPEMPVLVDGEVVGRTPCEFTVHPAAIDVMQPVEKS